MGINRCRYTRILCPGSILARSGKDRVVRKVLWPLRMRIVCENEESGRTLIGLEIVNGEELFLCNLKGCEVFLSQPKLHIIALFMHKIVGFSWYSVD